MEANVCEWVTITAPESIHDSTNAASHIWLEILQMCSARKEYSGYQQCHWGRTLETPSDIYIWTSWINKRAYDQYTEQETHRALYEKLRLLSSTQITVKIILFDGESCYTRGRLESCWPSITLLHFAEVLSIEQRQKVQNVDAITKLGAISDQFVRSQPARGFLLRTEEECSAAPSGDTYAILDYWRHPVQEHEVRHQWDQVYQVDDSDGHVFPQWFADGIFALGCTTVEMRHMRFNWLVRGCVERFPNEVIIPQSLEYDWDKGRKRWENEKPRLELGCTLGLSQKQVDRRVRQAQTRQKQRDKRAKSAMAQK